MPYRYVLKRYILYISLILIYFYMFAFKSGGYGSPSNPSMAQRHCSAKAKVQRPARLQLDATARWLTASTRTRRAAKYWRYL